MMIEVFDVRVEMAPEGTRCSWCGEEAVGEPMARVGTDSVHWWECGWCCSAIVEYGLRDASPEEVQRHAAQLREDTAA
jgi:hypothetical protein